MTPARAVLHLVGYPLAVVGIFRLRHAFRRRDPTWVVAEEAGVAAIVAGWLLAGNLDRYAPAAALNAAWGVGLAAAWALTGRRRRARGQQG